MLKKLLKSIMPKGVKEKLGYLKNNYFDGYVSKSYSQEGEDMILRRLFESQETGFYVDVGAHHPMRFSNTYFFYKKGWRGINIDAMPGSMILFDKLRRRDINLEIPISDKQETLAFYVFNEPALNSFSKQIATTYERSGYKILHEIHMQTKTLDALLYEYITEKQEIDFLTIDVEGLDLSVLKSLSLDKYKPKVILVEILEIAFCKIEENEISKYLKQYDYEVFAKSVNTVFFIKNSFFSKHHVGK